MKPGKHNDPTEDEGGQGAKKEAPQICRYVAFESQHERQEIGDRDECDVTYDDEGPSMMDESVQHRLQDSCHLEHGSVM